MTRTDKQGLDFVAIQTIPVTRGWPHAVMTWIKNSTINDNFKWLLLIKKLAHKYGFIQPSAEFLVRSRKSAVRFKGARSRSRPVSQPISGVKSRIQSAMKNAAACSRRVSEILKSVTQYFGLSAVSQPGPKTRGCATLGNILQRGFYIISYFNILCSIA